MHHRATVALLLLCLERARARGLSALRNWPVGRVVGTRYAVFKLDVSGGRLAEGALGETQSMNGVLLKGMRLQSLGSAVSLVLAVLVAAPAQASSWDVVFYEL